MEFQSIFDSNFITAAIGSLCGAYAGALAVQRAIDKKQEKNDLFRDIRNLNTAIMLSYHIVNSALSFKKQCVIPALDEMMENTCLVECANEKRYLEGTKENLYISLNFISFPEENIPIESLKQIVLEKTSVSGKAISAISHIELSVLNLNKLIKRRNELNVLFRKSDSQKEVVYKYAGIVMPDGNVDREYPETLEGINTYLNDIIFFSKVVCDELISHGDSILSSNKKITKNKKIHKVDFDTPEAKGLMPDKNEYRDWEGGFTS